MHRLTSPFTLVELMVTMVITSILFALFLPLFDTIVSGNSVSAGARLVGTNVGIARQLAQTSRNHVALVIPGDPTLPGGRRLDDDYKFAMVRLAYVDNDGTTFEGWLEDSKWTFLPTGALTLQVDDHVGIKKGTGGAKEYTNDPLEYPYPGPTITNIPYDDWLCVESDGTPANSNTTGTSRGITFRPTGKPDHASRYISIGESVYVGNTFIHKKPWQVSDPEKFKGGANQITIKINGFTSAVSYITPDRYPDDPTEEP